MVSKSDRMRWPANPKYSEFALRWPASLKQHGCSVSIVHCTTTTSLPNVIIFYFECCGSKGAEEGGWVDKVHRRR